MYVCNNEEILCDGRRVVGRGRMRYSYALCNDIIIYIYSTKKVKEISENHDTEHQNKQLFNSNLFV